MHGIFGDLQKDCRPFDDKKLRTLTRGVQLAKNDFDSVFGSVSVLLN